MINGFNWVTLILLRGISGVLQVTNNQSELPLPAANDGYNYDTGTIEITDDILKKFYLKYTDSKDKNYFAYIMLDDKEIGEVTIHYNIDLDTNLVCTLIENKYRNKGYGKIVANLIIDKAFNDLKLKELSLRTSEDNLPAIKSFIDYGFKLEKLNLNDIRFGNKEKLVCIRLTKMMYKLKRKKHI